MARRSSPTRDRDTDPDGQPPVYRPANTGQHPILDSPLPTAAAGPERVENDRTTGATVTATGVDLGPRWWSAYGRIRVPRRQFAIRLAMAAVLITAATLTNRSFLGWGLFVVFAVLFVPGTRARSFVLSFVPYGAVWFVFAALRSLADETVLARTVNLRAANLERYLFGGELPTIVLQQRFFDPDNIRWWDFALTAVHWSYFLVPHIVAIRLWHKHPALFRHYLGAMTLLLAVGLAIYFLIPSNPPWLSGERFNSPAAPTVLRVMQPVAEQLNGGLYRASYQVIGESNPIAAMPSIHMAITFLLIFPARRVGGRWHVLAWVYAASMGLALVYLGEHYVIDVLVGAVVTSYGWYAAGAWTRRLRTLRHHEADQGSSPFPSPPNQPAA